jgi:hypothetical protein
MPAAQYNQFVFLPPLKLFARIVFWDVPTFHHWRLNPDRDWLGLKARHSDGVPSYIQFVFLRQLKLFAKNVSSNVSSFHH